MAFVLNDRVKETTTTNGTSTINLAGAETGFESFVAGIGNSNTTYYAIVHQTADEFEVGIGTVTDASPDTLSRTTIISSSNSDSAVNFSSGTKNVFCTLPASKTVFVPDSGDLTVESGVQDGDILFKGNDGGSTITALTLDMSEAGQATFNSSIVVGGTVSLNSSNTSAFAQAGDNIFQLGTSTSDDFAFFTNNSESMRIDSGGNVLIGKNDNQFSIAGTQLYQNGEVNIVTGSGVVPLYINRLADDGNLIYFYQAGSQEGAISVSGSTVSYNGGHLSRWSQLADNTRDNTILKGTVMTNLDQMAEWTTDGVTEDNEQLNCMAVSSVEGDANVAGVFVNWDNDDDVYTNDMNVAMTGDMVIRIAKGTTVARGDLLMSAGDGTAKPQGDDIVRSKTIAKVTSTNVSHTYDDGTYLVPCVLMAC